MESLDEMDSIQPGRWSHRITDKMDSIQPQALGTRSLEQKIEAMVERSAKGRHQKSAVRPPAFKRALARTELGPEAPAPRTTDMIARRGLELSTAATEAWAARLEGVPIIEVARKMAVSIDTAKALINEAHTAIAEDLKESLARNRELDLARIDGLLATYYPQARQGDLDSAKFVIQALAHRAKLTGAEPPTQVGRTNEPTNVLIWIQQQMPLISRIVDNLPSE